MNKELKISINKNSKNVGDNIFLLFNLFSFISAFIFDIRAGVMGSITIIAYYIIFKKLRSVFCDSLFIIYFLICFFSGFFYIYNGRPFFLYLSSLSYNLIPMLMYGIGLNIDAVENKNPVYKKIVISNIILITLGFIIYFSPSLADSLNMDSINTAGINAAGVGYRFSSYLDSLTLGSVSSITIPLLLLLDYPKRSIIKYIYVFISIIATFLTMQRGAWIVGMLGILGCIFISLIKEKKHAFATIITYMVIGCFAFYGITYFVDNFMSRGFLTHLYKRINNFNLDSMYSSRNNQMQMAINTFIDNPLGLGIGSAGVKAASYNMAIVPDGNLLKILVETGVIGFVLFATLNIRGVIRGIKQKKYYSVLILVLFILHATGSNVFDFYYSSFVYWCVLGYLNQRYSCKNNDMKK